MSALAVGRFRFVPALAAVVLTVLTLWLLGTAAEIFLLLFLAILISLYLGAVTDFLHSRTRLPRRPALAVSVLGTLGAVVGLFWLLVPPVVEQTQELVKVLPNYIVSWESGIERFIARIPALQSVWEPGEHKVLVAVYAQIAGYFNNLLPKLASVLHGAIVIFSVVVMGLYLTLHPGMYREFLIALFPPVHRDLVRNVLGDLARTLRAWIVGQLIAMLLLGALTAAGLYVLRVPYWLTFGVFTGAVAIVPFFGALVSTVIPAIFVIGGSGGVTHALAVIGLGIVVHVIEANWVLPRIMEKQVDLPPVLTIMAVLLLGKLLGPMGLLVAVPTVAVLMVVVRRILINRIYEGQGFRRSTRDSVHMMRVPPPDGGVIVSPLPLDVVSLAEARGPRRVA
ncbi:MAG: AI-2E family transporter [Gemmatimonadota bacterium]|nr:AI-2E family transporter [Gemmatimonadota bacterium]